MKKFIAIVILFLLLLFILYWSYYPSEQYKVLKIITPTTIAVDFNKNNKIDNDEIIKIFGIVDLQSLNKDDINFFKKRNEFTDNDINTIKTLSYDLSKQLLENKFIKTIKIFHLKNEYIVFIDGMNYADLLLNNNFAFHKYYFKRKTFKKKSVNKKDNNKKFKENKFKKFPKPELYFSQNNIEMYISDYTDNLKPDYNCNKKIAKRLIKLINSAQKSIDIAVYDMTPNSCMANALKSAQKRGVNIRFVIDKKTNEEENIKLNKIFNDFENKSFDTGKDMAKLMHNKFMIIDDEILQAGSLNYSHTDLSEYNSNVVVIIKNKNIAQIYKKEFEQMYDGNFHARKIIDENNRCFDLSGINVCGYFSPQDKIIETQIIPLVRSAKHSLYIPIFVITYKSLVNELIKAKSRGVDVKLIVDATSASNPYYNVKKLRDAGILVKVENYAGKMHMKAVIVDESVIGIGSINFSNSGQNKNDENFMIIKSPYLAKNYAKYFMYLWQIIPDAWLKHNPRAESKYSIGSCSDGIDNNYDGNIDSADEGCK